MKHDIKKRTPSARLRLTALVALAATLVTGCTKKEEGPTVNVSMREVMEPMAEKIWAIASSAYNDVGDGFAAQKITDGDWKKLGDASRTLKERAEYFATAEHVIVAKANEPILGSQAVGVKGKIGPAWDAVNSDTVQKRIDANPALFKQKAQTLVDAADALVRASETHDAPLFYKVSSGMDEVCDGCHEPFWGTDEPPQYPH